MGHTNTTLVEPIDLILPSGFYAVSGASGSGKSSFLSKVSREQGNGVWATGKLTYITPDGVMPDVFIAEQLTYIPSRVTLRELITLTEDEVHSKGSDGGTHSSRSKNWHPPDDRHLKKMNSWSIISRIQEIGVISSAAGNGKNYHY